mmetsp:Transcript_8719/g.18561  ORF Transcript_8719/g.18561 Transcript_8719/m.18561 type:complete len:219 (+) Transcript_8719:1315-1971(+)
MSLANITSMAHDSPCRMRAMKESPLINDDQDLPQNLLNTSLHPSPDKKVSGECEKRVSTIWTQLPSLVWDVLTQQLNGQSLRCIWLHSVFPGDHGEWWSHCMALHDMKHHRMRLTANPSKGMLRSSSDMLCRVRNVAIFTGGRLHRCIKLAEDREHPVFDHGELRLSFLETRRLFGAPFRHAPCCAKLSGRSLVENLWRAGRTIDLLRFSSSLSAKEA